MTRSLVNIRHADVSTEGNRILTNISWQLSAGQHWAVLGPNGSGKSTFLGLVRGDRGPDPAEKGRRVYTLAGQRQESPIGIRERIAFVSPERQDAYLRNNWDLTAEEVVYTGFFDSVWLYERLRDRESESADQVISLLGINDLRRKRILAMSEGEVRKVLIARALVSEPLVMILDEVCSGLDARSRTQVLMTVERVAQSGTPVLLATHRVRELVPSITHVVVMGGGRIVRQGERAEILGHGDAALLAPALPGAVAQRSPQLRPSMTSKVLVSVSKVDVYAEGVRLLRSITWQMRTDQNWAVLGRNGAGKTSFLKLITGELRPAAGGCIRWLGDKTRRSIWEVRKRMGVVSSDLQARYDDPVTVEQAVCSGFFSSIGLYCPATSVQRKAAWRWLRFLGLDRMAERDVRSLSYGEMRRVLIARAMVKDPELLLLDEACNGLDPRSRQEVLRMIEDLARRKTRVLLVTHHPEDIVPSITHIALMDDGTIVVQGERAAMLRDRRLADLLGS